MLRASLKGLFSRKLRLALAVVAIVLGVSFLSGAFVLTDSLGARFEKLFTSINENVDVQVALTEDAQDEDPQPRLTQQQLDQMSDVDGISAVAPDVSAVGVVPFDLRDGKPMTTSGAPQLGVGTTGEQTSLSLLEIKDGKWPSTDTEVALSRYTADQIHAKVNDRIKVYLPKVNEAREFTVVGVAVYGGDRDSLAGETLVAFTQAEAQRIFYGQTGLYSGVSFAAAPGVSQAELRDRIKPLAPAGFEAKTGEQANKDQANEVQQGLSQLSKYFFGPFAGIALVVGIFLIFNTFNIVVAQRTQELALFRAMGASWGQVTTSVLAEAVLVGVVGASLGLLGGIGLGVGGSALLTSLVDAQLPGAGIQVGTTPIVLSYVVGVLVTLVAAFVPAVRASAVPPLAAMREVARPDKPLRTLTIVGAAFAVPGAVLLGASLTGLGGFTLPGLLLGVLLIFLGVALLSPLLTRPLAGLIGRAVSWGVSGKLGVRNALRNPRRTAVTSAALMIGVTLVSAASVIGASFTTTIHQSVDEVVGAELIISTGIQGAPGDAGFSDQAAQRVRAIPGVDQVVPLYVTTKAKVNNGSAPFGGVFAMDDLAVARDMFAMETVSGELRTLGPGEFATDENTAKGRGWDLGDTVQVRTDKGGDQPYRLVGVYKATPIWTDSMILPKAAVANFHGPLAYQGYVSLDDGADAGAVRSRVEQVMSDFPLVTVGDRSSLVDQYTRTINIALGIIAVLLGVAILIALLGILNTLLLSIYERTRELGMLRAVGLSRPGVTRMVGTESVVLAVFGCVLGIILGVGLGAAISAALIDQDFLTTITIPWFRLVLFVVIAVVAGVLAALLPAWRAARINVLRAIAYE
jgi:putative ABC transport system permease protein